MSWVLVAVYLAVGSTTPIVQHRTYADKDTCQSAAKRYVEGTLAGQSRAFCLKEKR